MKKLKRFSSEEQKRFAKKMVNGIKEDFATEASADGTMYEVDLQKNRFRCFYSDDEMQETAVLVFRLCEMLKDRIEKDKIDQDALDKYAEETMGTMENKNLNDYARIITYVKCIMTPEMWSIYKEIAEQVRVGGAYLMLWSGPPFQSAIYSCYDVFLRARNEEKAVTVMEDIELSVPTFLMRAAMYMHSQDIKED